MRERASLKESIDEQEVQRIKRRLYYLLNKQNEAELKGNEKDEIINLYGKLPYTPSEKIRKKIEVIKLPNSKITKPQNGKIGILENNKTTKPQNGKIGILENNKTIKPQNGKIGILENNKTIKPQNSEISILENNKTIKPQNGKIGILENNKTIKPQNSEIGILENNKTIKPQNSETIKQDASIGKLNKNNMLMLIMNFFYDAYRFTIKKLGALFLTLLAAVYSCFHGGCKFTIKNVGVFSLALLGAVYSCFLIEQGQVSYELFGFPYPEQLAVGVVLTLALLKFWSAISPKLILNILMLGFIIFEGLVLYFGTEVNTEQNIAKIESRKEFLVADIKRIESEIQFTKTDIESYRTETRGEVFIMEQSIEKMKSQNNWNFKRHPKKYGVLDVQEKLNNYTEERRQGLAKLKKDRKFDENHKLLVAHKSEVIGITTSREGYSDIALKALIGLVMLLNLYIFHCLGAKFKKREDRKPTLRKIKEFCIEIFQTQKHCKN